jgi:hypothetical protein
MDPGSLSHLYPPDVEDDVGEELRRLPPERRALLGRGPSPPAAQVEVAQGVVAALGPYRARLTQFPDPFGRLPRCRACRRPFRPGWRRRRMWFPDSCG